MSKTATTSHSSRTAAHPLRKARKAAKLTLEQVGKRVGVQRAAVSKWECGKGFPRPAQAAALVALFPQLSLEQLYAIKRAA